MRFNPKQAQAKWITHPEDSEIRVKIRPFPMSEGMFIPGSDDSTLAQFMWQKFNYSLLEWEGFEDDDGNPLECNEENKKFIYDYFDELMMWISTEITDLKKDISAQKKT